MEGYHLNCRLGLNELFSAYSAAGGVRKNSKVFATEQGRYHNCLAPTFANTPAKHITTIALEKLQADILAAGRSPKTAKHVIDYFVHTKTGTPRSVPMTQEVYQMLSDINQRGSKDIVFFTKK